ncbi:hybrid sensor histidine kinase/response regulator [Leisingera methylohalidivorans]|uniref:histidine kinase n=1 Tax=Leisingera methylohalidivorans DSM 14336 TaxID=999552 RepID=V9VSB0_9RHOB|nr:ATP-binding protein [Leisingera methylohalidivorans]AHC99741.1 histidine kinase [Leisingera methylohalidivorans DSM 14336]
MDAAGAAALGEGSRLDLETLACLSGLEFCQEFVDQLAQAYAADLVTVGELKVKETERIMVLASWFDGLQLGDFEYESRGTPCHDVVLSGNPHVFLCQVQELYPDDKMLSEDGIQSYAGVALKNADGAAIGLIQAAWRHEIDGALAQQIVAEMQHFAPRLGAEAAALQTLATLAALAEGPGGTSPRAAFRHLAEQLQGAFKVRSAFIAECRGDRPECFRMLACCCDGQQMKGMEDTVVPYDGTPCALLKGRKEFLVPDGLQEAFPEQAQYRSRNLHSYLGIALTDAEGTEIGHFALQHDREIRRSKLDSGLSASFAARIGLELRRRKAERRRSQAEEALLIKRKTESLGLLAGTIAHDFNNLLASMQGRAELALAHLDAAHPAEAHLQELEQGLQASGLLVRQLLNYAKGGDSREQGVCDLNAIVQQAMALVPDARKMGKQVVLDLEQGALTARMDPSQVSQLVQNLVFNAAEAIGPGAGTVTVTTRRTSLSDAERRKLLKGRTMPAGACLLLEVRDTGSGMGRGTVTRIFDPFFTTKPGGRGLGMAAALGIISRHQGGLAVESREGGGSAFRFYFSACAAEPAAAAAVPVRERSLAVRQVLVVDDEDTVRRAVAGLLQLRGCKVLQADGYDAALALLQTAGPFDGAVIDMSMPGRGGWETLAGLRKIQPGLKAVMMSGFAISAVAAGFPDLSEVPVLDKPFTKEKLYRAVFT